MRNNFERFSKALAKKDVLYERSSLGKGAYILARLGGFEASTGFGKGPIPAEAARMALPGATRDIDTSSVDAG